MKTKAAILTHAMEIKTDAVELPSVGSTDVMVLVKACGVCPFDIRLYRGLAKTGFPKVLGHEVAGEIVEVGNNVANLYKGDMVALYPAVRCGNCFYCMNGQENLCVETKWPIGGFADYTVMPAKNAFKFSGISPEEAAFAEPLSCCLNGMIRADLRPGCDVVIIGDGPIGLLHLQLAQVMGASRVVVSGLMKERLERAARLGAKTVDAAGDSVKQVKEILGPMGGDAVIVAVGSTTALQTALQIVKRGGKIVQFAGIYPEMDVPIPSRFIHYSEAYITGSSDSTRIQFASALRLLENRRVKVADFVTHRYAIENAKDAIESAAKLTGFKVMIMTSSP
jgi:L-iditol 2-dehydrogenase